LKDLIERILALREEIKNLNLAKNAIQNEVDKKKTNFGRIGKINC